MTTTKTYHATIRRNDLSQRTVCSIGIGLNREDAVRIVRDLNTALAVLGANAWAELIEEANY